MFFCLLIGCGPSSDAPPSPGQFVNSPFEVPAQLGGFSLTGINEQRGEGVVEGHAGYSSPPGGACMVELDWWQPMPPRPGGPMSAASERSVMVDGVEAKLITTSAFEGTEQVVGALFLQPPGFTARVVFRECGENEQDQFLALLKWKR